MAITFLERRKIQRIYIIIFLIIILITALVLWRGFFVEEKPGLVEEALKPPKKVEIDFKILEHPILQGLEPFEEIKTYEQEFLEGVVTEKVGRENPFISY